MTSHSAEHPLFAGNIAQYNKDKQWRIDIPMQTAGKPVFWRQRSVIAIQVYRSKDAD